MSFSDDFVCLISKDSLNSLKSLKLTENANNTIDKQSIRIYHMQSFNVVSFHPFLESQVHRIMLPAESSGISEQSVTADKPVVTRDLTNAEYVTIAPTNKPIQSSFQKMNVGRVVESPRETKANSEGKAPRKDISCSEHAEYDQNTNVAEAGVCRPKTKTKKVSFDKEDELREVDLDNTFSGDAKFVCKVCFKEFSKQCYLNRHAIIHSENCAYSCEFCGRNFAQTSHLKVHIRSHTGERPFSCDYCGKRFSHKSNVKLHLKSCPDYKLFFKN